MRALVMTQYGGPEVLDLVDLPDPTPAAGEVLVRTTAAGLNPVDALLRNGGFKALDPYTFPKTAGNELSGVVESVGAGVTAFAPGDAVVARTRSDQLGAFAELVAVDASYVATAPTAVPLADAAGLPLAGLTAQQALGPDHLDLRSGEQLLVTGAAGGVGLLAVQLAVLAGAEVTATASPEGDPLVREAGATRVVNYREQKVSESGQHFDKVLDLVGGDGLVDLFATVVRGGRVVTIAGPPSPGSLQATAKGWRRGLGAVAERAQSRGIRSVAQKAGASYEFFLMHPDGHGLANLARLVDSGQLSLRVDSRFPVEQYRQAFERLESRHAKGKVLLEFRTDGITARPL